MNETMMRPRKLKSNYIPTNNAVGSTLAIFFILNFIVDSTSACNIWSTSSCRDRITKADLELMKSDDYSKDELYNYCDKGKEYVDCVNEKLKCCDLREDLFKSLKAFDKKLEKYAWKLAPYCSGLGTTNIATYRCRTTTRVTTTTTINIYKGPSLPKCEVKKVSLIQSFLCGKILKIIQIF